VGELALHAKRNLCKDWHSIAIEFLYEFIWISEPKRLLLLLCSLGSHASWTLSRGTQITSQHFGRSIKSLWLSIGRPPPFDDWPSGSEFNCALDSLLNACVDLHILRVWYSVQLNLPVVGKLCSSLCYIDLTCNIMGKPALSHHLLDCFVHPGILEMLQLTFPNLEGTDLMPNFPQSPFYLLQLHSLILKFELSSSGGWIMRLMASWELPRLVYLSISNDLDFGDQFSPDMQRFFRSFGRNLANITLRGFSNEVVTNVIKWSPSVQNLWVLLREPNLYSIQMPTAPHLQRIRLSLTKVGLIHYRYQTFVKVAETLSAIGKPLRCIQLMDMTNVYILRQFDWEKWHELRWKLLLQGICF
jgi:hypothetical protein